MNHELIDSIAATSTKTTIVIAAGTTIGGLTADEWSVLGVIIGIAGTIIMVVFTLWFKMKYQR